MARPETQRDIIAPERAQILATREAITPSLVHTPLLAVAGHPGSWLKPEMLQPHGSFKLRAALGAMRDAGVGGPLVTASAGNFGQGLAGVALRQGRRLTVAVPENAARGKLAAMEQLDACLVRMSFDDWWRVFSERHLPGHDGHFVHPVAETGVIAGNASIGCEIAEALPDVASVVVPFGGGGLAVGIALGLRAMGSSAQVVVVESEACDQVAAAFAAGVSVTVERRPSFIDGMGGRGVLPEMWPLVRSCVGTVVQVTIAEIEDAIAALFLEHRIVAEGAGAAALAAVRRYPDLPRPIVGVLSGGNLDPTELCRILRRSVNR